MFKKRNILSLFVFTLSTSGMLGLSFASVPLYKLFCQATGFNGIPKIGPSASPGITGASIEIHFDATVSPLLPWKFTPDTRVVHVLLGQESFATYTGENISQRESIGVATYNVMPEKAAAYFHKTACFCFDEQRLEPGQTATFSLSFWVDPAISTDPNTRDVSTITLSYMFFRSLKDVGDSESLSRSGPHVGKRIDQKG